MKQPGQRTLLGFDFGTRSIGVAIGQEITGSAQPLRALKANDGVPNWDEIQKLLAEWQPDRVIVGLPLNMDGTEQPLTQRARKFANRIHGRFGIVVELQDERLTTTGAPAGLFPRGGFPAPGKGMVGGISARLVAGGRMNG